MPDLNELDRSGSTKISGSDATGLEDNFMNVDTNGSAFASIRNTAGTAMDFNTGAIGAATLRVAAQIANASGSADFGAGNSSAQTLRIVIASDQVAIPVTQSGTWTVQQGSTPTSIANAWPVKPTDGTNSAKFSTNNDQYVRDVINTSGQYRAQSVTTTAAEALGAGTILVNRKFISITPTNGTVYWGFSNTVTISSGTPIFKNQKVVFKFSDNVHIFLISAGTVDCRIAEGS